MTRRSVPGALLVLAFGIVVLLLATDPDEGPPPPVERTATDDLPGAAVLIGTGRAAEAESVEDDLPYESSETARRPEAGSWTVEGSVLDLEREPVGGVPIQDSKGITRATSQDDGTFRFDTAAGSVWIRLGGDWRPTARRVARGQTPVVLFAIRTLSLRIRVLGPDGAPAAGIRVHVRSSHRDDDTSITRSTHTLGPTGQDGLLLTGFPESTLELALAVHDEKHYVRRKVDFPYSRAVTLRLKPRLYVRGRVLDDRGETIVPRVGSFMIVSLDPDLPGEVFEHDCVRWDADLVPVENEDGTFSMPEPDPEFLFMVPGPGPWRVHYEPRQNGLTHSDPVVVRAPATGVRIQCLRPVAIRGRVLDVGDARFHVHWIPAPCANGHARPSPKVGVGRHGAFRVTHQAAGPGTLFVRCQSDDRYGLIEGVVAPLDDVRIRLVDGLTLRGRVEDVAACRPMRAAKLRILAEADGIRAQATVGEDGTFTIRGLPPRRYALSWRWYAEYSVPSAAWVPCEAFGAVDPEAGPVTLPPPEARNDR